MLPQTRQEIRTSVPRFPSPDMGNVLGPSQSFVAVSMKFFASLPT